LATNDSVAWSNVSRHALNSAFALFEIFLTHGGPPPWPMLPFCFLMLVGYLGVAYITYDTQHFYGASLYFASFGDD
jgi:hypothetical protein